MSMPIAPFPEDTVSVACEEALGYPPKRFQMAATKALHAGRNTLVISPTGSGKSLINRLIFFSPTIPKDAMLINVTPLIALQKEQVMKDKQAVCINVETKTPGLLKRIKGKEFRRIYMGPKQLQCDDVRVLLRSSEWTKDLIAYIDS